MGDDAVPGGPPKEADEEILARALRCPALSAEALSRLRTAVEAEWQSRPAEPRRRRTPWVLAAALLGLAATLGVAWWVAANRVPNDSIGTLAAGDSAPLVLERVWLPDIPLTGRRTIRVGDVVHATQTGIVSIAGGGRLFIQNGSRLLVNGAHEVTLRRGALYVDLDPATPHGHLDVRTTFGLVHHVGTQFEVALLPDAMRVRVREGAVRIDGPVAVQAQAGQEVRLGAGQSPQYQPFEASDAAWRWVEAPAALSLENRSVMSFLHWVARQTGCKLQFADEQSRLLAERTILHGSMREMPVESALHAVLGATSLTASLDHGSLLVRKAPIPRPPHL